VTESLTVGLLVGV